MTTEELVALLRSKVKEEKSLTVWAGKHGCSTQYVSQALLRGDKGEDPPNKVRLALAHAIGAANIVKKPTEWVVVKKPGRPRRDLPT